MEEEKLWLYISKIFHPMPISPFLGILYLFLAGFTPLESLKWVGISAAVTIIPIATYMAFSDKFDSFNAIREKRGQFYLMGAVELLILAALFHFMNAPELINTPVYSLIALLFIGWATNSHYTKISIHTGIISGFASVIAFLDPSIGAVLGLLTIIVGYSRTQVNAHTPKQVVLGALVPVPVIAATFIFFL